MEVYYLEECKIEPNNNFYKEFELHNQIYHLKEELLPYNIKEPIFINYYKELKMENILDLQDNEDNNIPPQSEKIREELIKIDRDIDQEEQINEIKINLFFILELECKYNNEYSQMISNNYFKAKRLVIQDYEIKDNTIQFGEKSYSFISLHIKGGDIVFESEGNEIKLSKIKDKDSKKGDNYQMEVDGNKIMNEEEFQEKYKNIELKKGEKFYKKTKSDAKRNKSAKSDINESKNTIFLNNINNKSTKTFEDNKTFSQKNLELNENISKISETSLNEIIGKKFFSEKKRYIFQKSYEKQIDGIYNLHKVIKLNKEGKIDLNESLESLLKDSYDIENDIKSHIIYKNFENNEIKSNEPFILEVKKSMAGLAELLIQIKEISKFVNSSSISLPNLVIGIICFFDKEQIEKQKLVINKKYKENSEDKFVEYIIKIIENNKLNVLIAAIKDQQICGYPLGFGDFLIKNLNLKKRIDINYFNEKICNGKYNSKELEKFCLELPYKSLSFDISEVSENYYKIKKDYETMKKKNEEKDKIISEQAQQLTQQAQQLTQQAQEILNLKKEIEKLKEGKK